METKYLWDRVDALRDALKDIKEENDDLIAENKHLKLRVEELDGFSDDVDVERSRAEVENDKLKAELNDFKSNYVWSDEVDKLKAENDSLKDEAVKWNRKYNKACYKIEYPKDYLKEAKEHFHHNPNCKGVRFHMIDFDEYDYDNNDGLNGLSGEYNGSLMAEDCLVEIDNNTTKLKFH